MAEPIIVPGGTTTGAHVELIRVKRKTPEFHAARYDGTNAVQIAAWLLTMGRNARVDFKTDRPPVLISPTTSEVIKPGWLLPSLEPIAQEEIGVTYDQVGEVEVVPITNGLPITPPVEPEPAP